MLKVAIPTLTDLLQSCDPTPCTLYLAEITLSSRGGEWYLDI